MKTYLQIDLNSNFSKNYYQIHKNQLQLTKDTPHTLYHFDSISYSNHDINSTMIYDIVLDYSNKITTNHPLSTPQPITSLNCQKTLTTTFNTTFPSTHISSDPKQQSTLNYLAIFDKIQTIAALNNFIKQISQAQVFKNQSITIGHFLIYNNQLFDFHYHLTKPTQFTNQQITKTTNPKNQYQDTQMNLYDKQINLCQQISYDNISNIDKNIIYLSVTQFQKLNQLSINNQFISKFNKSQLIKFKQFQNKKIEQFYILNINSKIKIFLLLLNYNKNYSFTPQQHKQFIQLLTLYGNEIHDIKYQNIKIQILHNFMKNLQQLYYVMYFPGPRLTSFAKQIQTDDLQQKNAYNLSTYKTAMMQPPSQTLSTTDSLSSYYLKQLKQKNNQKLSNQPQCNHILKSQIIAQRSKINNQYRRRYYLYIHQLFQNFTALNTDKATTLQKINKQNFTKKQSNLKAQLTKLKQRINQLQITQKTHQSTFTQLKSKCSKALQKVTPSIHQLQILGITNIQKHMDWLRAMPQQKKQQIKQQQDQIQQINKRLIQTKKSHQFFINKMNQFKTKLQSKQIPLSNNITSIQKNHKNIANDKQNNHILQLQNIHLSPQQCKLLQQYRIKKKKKMLEKLQASQQKKYFIDTFNHIKQTISKSQFIKLQQQYFDLIHN